LIDRRWHELKLPALEWQHGYPMALIKMLLAAWGHASCSSGNKRL